MEEYWFRKYISLILNELKDLNLAKSMIYKFYFFLIKDDNSFEDLISIVDDIKNFYDKDIFYKAIEYIIGDLRENELIPVLNAIYGKDFEFESINMYELDKVILKYEDENLYKYLQKMGYIPKEQTEEEKRLIELIKQNMAI